MENPNRNNRSFDQTAMLTFNYFTPPPKVFPYQLFFHENF